MLKAYKIYLHISLGCISCRKTLLDTAPEDPNYNPLPEEERPGGYDWGEDQRPQNEEDQPQENQDQH